MLAAQDAVMEDAATTLYQLSEDERVRMECWAREDSLKREQAREDIIAEQKREIAEKDIEIAEKDRIIAELQAQLATGKK